MAVTSSLRKTLDLKRWEMCGPLLTGFLTNNAFGLCASTQSDGLVMLVTGTVNAWLYSTLEDAWLPLTSPALTTWAQPAMCYHPSGPTGTASAGSANTITTVTTIPGSLAGYTVRITAGTGAGQERTISGNTFGANSVVTVSSNWGTNPDNTSVYLILSGRFWVLNWSSTVMMKYYDVATNTWSTARTVTGIGTPSAGNGSALTATPAFGNACATGTATSATSTTLSNSGKSWTASQWINYQVRITGGTGAGQVRTITANTSTQLTVAAWGTTPDATSTYSIEPNDDFLYLAGNAAITLFRYSISGDSWSTLSPGVARTTAANSGCSLAWVGTASDTSWAATPTTETSIKNGRYLYSFAGNGSANLAVYDIAANSWSNVQTSYQRSGGTDFTPTSSWSWCADREYTYYIRTTTTSPVAYTVYRFNAVTQSLDPWTMFTFPQAAAPANCYQAFIGLYFDSGSVALRWLYYLTGQTASPAPMLRMLII